MFSHVVDMGILNTNDSIKYDSRSFAETDGRWRKTS